MKYSFHVTLLMAIGLLCSCSSTKIESETYFRLCSSGDELISHSIKLPFGPNGAIGVHIGDDLHIVTLSKGKKIGVDKLKSVAELMRNRAEGFIAGYRDRMESGLGGKQPEVSEEYRSVKHDTEWKSSYGEGWWLATMESDW